MSSKERCGTSSLSLTRPRTRLSFEITSLLVTASKLSTRSNMVCRSLNLVASHWLMILFSEKQTVEFNIEARVDFKSKKRARMGVWDAMEMLNTLIDESDPDVRNYDLFFNPWLTWRRRLAYLRSSTCCRLLKQSEGTENPNGCRLVYFPTSRPAT